ncbi:hypothetical protein RGL36_004009 [Vibrio parahaemolyticus]|nr:hypothetical protein [Vibrio parahaemolyticus]
MEMHIKDLLDSDNAADRWLGNQYKRAREFDQRGEHTKAKEIREYALQQATHRKGLSKIVEDNWPGDPG